MAANNNRQNNNNGGNNNNNNNNQGMNNEHVEFSVRAEEDLYLTGNESTIRRVAAETNYSCLMLKTQRFSSLFRHYAKYHGLRKDDLEYYFVNLLQNDDTPESVQLQRGDTIMVRKRRGAEPAPAAADDDEFLASMKELLEDETHMDVAFVLCSSTTAASATGAAAAAAAASPTKKEEAETEEMQDDNDEKKNKGVNAAVAKEDDTTNAAAMMEIDSSNTPFGETKEISTSTTATAAVGETIAARAHKSVLTARTDYFKTLFSTNEDDNENTSKHNNDDDEDTTVPVDSSVFSESHVRYVLEFIYTNRVVDLPRISTDDLLSILHLANLWLLRDLKRMVEHELVAHHMNTTTVAKLYGAAASQPFQAKRLSKACLEFIMTNLRQLAGNEAFETEMKQYPHLCIPVLKAAADLIPEGPPAHKKQRTSSNTNASETPNSAGAAFCSSPVPDSDA